jgi:hypothetical protein
MIHPASDRLIRDPNRAHREQIFDVAQTQREPEVEPNRLLNDLGREPIAGAADFPHAHWLPRDQSINKPAAA